MYIQEDRTTILARSETAKQEYLKQASELKVRLLRNVVQIGLIATAQERYEQLSGRLAELRKDVQDLVANAIKDLEKNKK